MSQMSHVELRVVSVVSSDRLSNKSREGGGERKKRETENVLQALC